jgi:hypothetical protein
VIDNSRADLFIKNRKQRQSLHQFKEILKLIIFCYGKIIKAEIFDWKEIQKNTRIKPENYLKYILLQYLRKNKKNFPTITHLSFSAESANFNSTESKEAFIDIAVYGINNSFTCIPELLQKSLTDEDYYFAFECKRLENLRKNNAYIKDGIRRYVGNIYARAMPFAGMIGFVEKGNIIKIKNNINDRLFNLNKIKELETIKMLALEELEKDFKFSYVSIHRRVENIPIKLYHLFLDYTEIVR